MKYTIYAPTTVTLGKTGIPWNTDGEYMSKKGGQNALFFAVQKHDLESARMLLDAGLDVNQAAADGTTPLLASLYNWDPPNTTFIPGKGAPAPGRDHHRFCTRILRWHNFCSTAARRPKPPIAPDTRLCTAPRWRLRMRRWAPDFRKGGGLRRQPGAAESRTGREQAADRNNRAGAGDRKDTARRRRRPEPADALSDCRVLPAMCGSTLHPRLIRVPHRRGVDQSCACKALADKGANPNLLRKDGHTPFSVAVMAGQPAMSSKRWSRAAPT